MDREGFLSVVGAAPLLAPATGAAPAAVGVNDVRLLVTIARVNRIGVLADSSTFLFLSAASSQVRMLHVPRPASDDNRWNVVPPPLTPLVNPAYRNSDVVYDEVPDAVTASIPYRMGAVFAFNLRHNPAYLVYATPQSTSFAVRALHRGPDVQALFLGPDGIHVVFDATAAGQVVVSFPPP